MHTRRGVKLRVQWLIFGDSLGVNRDHVDLGKGSYRGNPGPAPELAILIEVLDRAQKESGSNIAQKA